MDIRNDQRKVKFLDILIFTKQYILLENDLNEKLNVKNFRYKGLIKEGSTFSKCSNITK